MIAATTYTRRVFLTHSSRHWGLTKSQRYNRNALAVSVHARMELTYDIATPCVAT